MPVSSSLVRRYHWIGIGALGLLALGLGTIGFQEIATRSVAANGPTAGVSGWGDILYQALQLFTLESGAVEPPTPVPLEIARWLAPITAGYATAMALLAIFQDQAQRLRVRFLRDHVVLCGVHREATILAAAFSASGARVVLIDDAPNVPEAVTMSGWPVIRGDAREPIVLGGGAAHARARLLVAATADSGFNAQVALAAREMDPGRSWPPLTCVAEIRELELCRLLREREFSEVRASGFRLEFANLAEIAARTLFSNHPPVAEPGRPEHVLVVGSGELCQLLTLLAVQRANESTQNGLHVTVIGAGADDLVDHVRERWPGLDHACSLHVESVEPGPGSFGALVAKQASGGVPPISHCYVSLGDDPASISAARTLQRIARREQANIPIVVAVDDDEGLIRLVTSGGPTDGSSIECFPLGSALSDVSIVASSVTEGLARSIHERYVANRLAAGDTPEKNSSLLQWSELPEALKDSNRSQAEGMIAALNACSLWTAPRSDWSSAPAPLPEEKIERLAQLEHERWANDLRLHGWTYGSGAKNPGRRTHPSLVEWSELPASEREKDLEAVKEWPALLAGVGLQIEDAPG